MFPPISYLPDPGNPNLLYGQFDPRYSIVQQYYSNKAQYLNIDTAAIDLAQRNWKQWAVGAVIANNAGQFKSYRQAPVAPKSHSVTWSGTSGVIAEGTAPVWFPDPTWDVNDWQVGQTGTGEDLVKINDPARKKQTGGFAGQGTPPSAPAPVPALSTTDLSALLQQILAALAAQKK